MIIWVSFQNGFFNGGLIMLVGGLIVSSIDNFLKPILINDRTQIHALLIFFSLFGGIQLFGILGILFGPVITALFIATVNIYREESMHTRAL